MRIHPLQLTAHKGLRAEILLALKRTQPLTAKQLAHQLGVSVNAIRHHPKEPGAAAAERIDLVARLMNEQGYMAEWQEAAGTFRLSEHNCAIRAVAERFPEVCAAEERFLRDVLGAAVERRAHIASGCNACEYVI